MDWTGFSRFIFLSHGRVDLQPSFVRMADGWQVPLQQGPVMGIMLLGGGAHRSSQKR